MAITFGHVVASVFLIGGAFAQFKVAMLANESKEIKISHVKEIIVNISEDYFNDVKAKKDNLNKKASQFFWRVNFNLTDEGKEGILSVMVEQGQNTKFLQLPTSSAEQLEPERKTLHDRVVDLCPDQDEEINESSTLRVYIVSSNSNTSLNLRVKATLEFEGDGWKTFKNDDGQIIELNQTSNFSFDSPLIHTAFVEDLLHGTNDHYVNLRIESPENSSCFCSILSVQEAGCPYQDQIGDAKRVARVGTGLWQTVDRSSSMVVNVNKFGKKILIVLIGADDSLCNFSRERKEQCRNSSANRLSKDVTIRLEPIARNTTRLTATLVVALGYLVIMVVCLVVSGYRFRIQNNLFELFENMNIVTVAIAQTVAKAEAAAEVQIGVQPTVEEGAKKAKRKKMLAMTTTKMTLPEKSRSRYQKNELFMGGLLMVSIFYAVTVLQTAFNDQARQHKTGNYDICYYNSRCQIPLGDSFLDFNHFFSNLGYIVFGFTFIGIVAIKGKKFAMGDQDLLNRHGIPFLSGVYYTMGGAIAMEGVMSAAYHICPTTVSFQFDTTYMYLIAILIYVKLYQNRHPDTSSNSVQAYLVLGGAIVLEAISIYSQNSEVFWAFFCLVYMISLVFLVAHIYQMDTHRQKCQSCKDKCKCLKRFIFIRVYALLADESMKAMGKVYNRKLHRIRPLLVFISTTFCINVGLCAFFAWNASQKDTTASNYLLYLFIINMALYLTYYIAMKKISGERLSYLAWWYFGRLKYFRSRVLFSTFLFSSSCKPVLPARNVVLCPQGEEFERFTSRVARAEPALSIIRLLRWASIKNLLLEKVQSDFCDTDSFCLD